MRKNDTIECSRVLSWLITHTLNEFNQINVKLLISIQTLIFQFSHSHPLLTLRLGDLWFKEKSLTFCTQTRAIVTHVRALIMQKLCVMGMRNAVVRIHLKGKIGKTIFLRK